MCDRTDIEAETADELRDQFQPLASKYLKLAPTITIRSGRTFNIFVVKPKKLHPIGVSFMISLVKKITIIFCLFSPLCAVNASASELKTMIRTIYPDYVLQSSIHRFVNYILEGTGDGL